MSWPPRLGHFKCASQKYSLWPRGKETGQMGEHMTVGRFRCLPEAGVDLGHFLTGRAFSSLPEVTVLSLV